MYNRNKEKRDTMNLTQRFLNYVKVDTESDPKSNTYPTTMKQFDLAHILVKEMKEMGISDAHVDEYGIVYGSILANTELPCATIGFIAHMDTSPDMSGKDVKPRIVEKYDGNTIVLNEALNITMSPKEYPSLAKHVGHDLIVTDGTTLLGADDKAGVAEILDMCQRILASDEKHGTIKIAFTPDEEVGKGPDNFDVEKFGADYAYTVDGGDIECIDFENFNAASALVKFSGSSIHPGEAKNKMRNAILMAFKFHSLLPQKDDPALTEGYEGFNHVHDIKGGCEYAEMEYIIRNHDKTIFEKQKQDFILAKDFMNAFYGSDVVEVEIKDQYANMRELIETKMEIVEKVEDAMRELGMHPKHTPIRGGTDGAQLTYRGLLCPNLGTGGYNFHGKYEYVSIQSMQKISDLLVKIVLNNAKE